MIVTRAASLNARIATAVVTAWCSSCDWEHYALMNSVPVHGDPALNPVVHVFIGVDGLSYEIVEAVLASEVVDVSGWSSARNIAPFPATSDVSWSRILHTKRVTGYEYEYYHPVDDRVKNKGYLGLLTHAIPPIDCVPVHLPAYYNAFDYNGNGYLSTLWNYAANELSFAESLDALFYLLDGQAEMSNVFSAYLLELDAMGHMVERDDSEAALLHLLQRIVGFQRRHPERHFSFTIYSDHGMDFIPAADDEMVMFEEVMRDVGVRPVSSLGDQNPSNGLYAVPVIHTRVSYLALHTHETLASDVARAVSSSHTVDLAVTKASAPAGQQPSEEVSWYSFYRGGRELLRYGHDSRRDHYLLPRAADYAALDLERLEEQLLKSSQSHTSLDDEVLFDATAEQAYPDLFYRVRTALSPVGVKYPAEVLVSFRRPYASRGFEIPGGANEIASAGFHGGLDSGGSSGVVLTNAMELPAAVRADNLLSIFPKLRDSIEANDVRTFEGDVHASLRHGR